MTAQTLQWVQKAEADYDVVLLLRRSRKPSRFDIIRFHCQQCVEKYLKARLQEAGIRFPRTHDLVALLTMLALVEPTWQPTRSQLAALTDAAVEYRYPNRWSGTTDARDAFTACHRLRALARKSFGLKA
jgi:HEPN domain-containing protein